jgi:hypothetical protein
MKSNQIAFSTLRKKAKTYIKYCIFLRSKNMGT